MVGLGMDRVEPTGHMYRSSETWTDARRITPVNRNPGFYVIT